ncbi:MAG: hypothetical protein JWQ78_1642, partial [Sediminibacterium sp.]|nr:hypothetical protein [Sediminibacterium sp.]
GNGIQGVNDGFMVQYAHRRDSWHCQFFLGKHGTNHHKANKN